MDEALEVRQGLCLNPYVVQMDKLTNSLKCLTRTFKDGQDIKGISEQNIRNIEMLVRGEVCRKCANNEMCTIEKVTDLSTMIQELVFELEEYGMELSVKKKRELEKSCSRFEEVKDKVQKEFSEIKKERLWTARINQSQDASIIAMQAFANAIKQTTCEIDASLFQDDRLERKISNGLRRFGIRPLKIVLFVSERGRYEIHITAKSKEGNYVTTKQMAEMISFHLGRSMTPERKERIVIGEEYDTVVFVERTRYQVLSGIAKKTKQGSRLSGDNFLNIDVAGGKTCVLLSDGMGSGEVACQESARVLEMAEVLLEAGITPELAMQMLNASLIREEKEVSFATLDLCMIDRYDGEIKLLKAGATTTYYVTKKKCQTFDATSLPIGVVPKINMNQYEFQSDKSGYIVMLTDGVMEGIQREERAGFIEEMVHDAKTRNPKEIAQIILKNAIELQSGEIKDDMMVFVIGMWELHF